MIKVKHDFFRVQCYLQKPTTSAQKTAGGAGHRRLLQVASHTRGRQMPPLPQKDQSQGQQDIAQGQIDDHLVKQNSQKLTNSQKSDTQLKQLPSLYAKDMEKVSSIERDNHKHDHVENVPLKRKINTMDDTEKIAAKHAEAQAAIEKEGASQENKKQNEIVKNSEANNDNAKEDVEDRRVENVEENGRDDENDGGDANEQKNYEGDNGYMESQCKYSMYSSLCVRETNCQV